MTKVGITGHRKLDEKILPWTREVMQRELAALDPPLVAVSSLAIGADQLLARAVLREGGSIYAVLPFLDIERSFTPGEVESYRQLVTQAVVEVLDTPGTDEDAYLAAGKRVVQLSDVLIAIWDGKPAKGKGGTADIVAYALLNGVPTLHINPANLSVHKICT